MQVEFAKVTAGEYRVIIAGRVVGVIAWDDTLGGGLWVAEWRHFALEFKTLGEAQHFVAADCEENGAPEGPFQGPFFV